MLADDDLIAISAMQHMVFCERQCALIHIEQTWTESGCTAEGRIMRERVHKENRTSRGDVRIDYGVSLRSLRIGHDRQGQHRGVSPLAGRYMARASCRVQAGKAQENRERR